MLHRIRWTHSLVLSLTFACAAIAAADPDFSGKWVLNRALSDIRSLPAPPASTLAIEHRGVTVQVSETAGTKPAAFSFTTDRKEARTKRGDTSMSSIAKWEGAALLVNTIVSTPAGSYSQIDRWALSRDGATLTVRRDVVRTGGTTRSILVYEPETSGLLASRTSNEPAHTALSQPAPSEPPAAPVAPPAKVTYTIEGGTSIPLTPLNTISSKHSVEGDRVYLTTIFPVLSNGRIVVPPGSYVMGTVTQVKRPGRVKGRGELFLRFDSLTLRNGVTRDFRARIGSMDGDSKGELDRAEGGIKSEGNKAGDARTVGEAAAAGVGVGAIAARVNGRYGMGAGIGGAAGAAAGAMGVLLTRGPDAVLPKGSTLEMKLDRALVFDESELTFVPGQTQVVIPAQPAVIEQRRSLPLPGRW